MNLGKLPTQTVVNNLDAIRRDILPPSPRDYYKDARRNSPLEG
jgi:hypothetical protein